MWKQHRTIAIPIVTGLGVLVALLVLLGGLGSDRLPVAQASPHTKVSGNADIVINEIMQNPDAVADVKGEWFELYNTGSTDVDINGWTIADDGTNFHIINAGGPLTVPAHGYLVLGRNISITQNGGVTVAYEYSNIYLGNKKDELILTDTTGTRIDYVAWDNGATFPDPTGASMELINPWLDNNVGANWCTANSQWPGSAGDKGSPGAQNSCATIPDLVVVKSGPATVNVGDFIVYSITLSNAGTTTATSALLTDTLPMDTTYVSDDSGIVPANPSPGVYVWDFGDVPSNTVHTFNLTGKVDTGVTHGTVLTNKVEASTDTLGDEPANNTDYWETTATTPQPVGGVTYPNNPVHLLMPWASLVVLAGLILAAGTMAIRKRTG